MPVAGAVIVCKLTSVNLIEENEERPLEYLP